MFGNFLTRALVSHVTSYIMSIFEIVSSWFNQPYNINSRASGSFQYSNIPFMIFFKIIWKIVALIGDPRFARCALVYPFKKSVALSGSRIPDFDIYLVQRELEKILDENDISILNQIHPRNRSQKSLSGELMLNWIKETWPTGLCKWILGLSLFG